MYNLDLIHQKKDVVEISELQNAINHLQNRVNSLQKENNRLKNQINVMQAQKVMDDDDMKQLQIALKAMMNNR